MAELLGWWWNCRFWVRPTVYRMHPSPWHQRLRSLTYRTTIRLAFALTLASPYLHACLCILRRCHLGGDRCDIWKACVRRRKDLRRAELCVCRGWWLLVCWYEAWDARHSGKEGEEEDHVMWGWAWNLETWDALIARRYGLWGRFCCLFSSYLFVHITSLYVRWTRD